MTLNADIGKQNTCKNDLYDAFTATLFLSPTTMKLVGPKNTYYALVMHNMI